MPDKVFVHFEYYRGYLAWFRSANSTSYALMLLVKIFGMIGRFGRFRSWYMVGKYRLYKVCVKLAHFSRRWYKKDAVLKSN